jgi:hypothetical protein
MGLRRQIVDLRRPGFLDDTDKIGRVGEVAMMQEEPGPGLMRIDIDESTRPVLKEEERRLMPWTV